MKRALVLSAVLLLTGSALFAQSFTVATFDDRSSQKGTSTITKVEAKETIGGKEYTTYTFKGVVTTAYQYGFAGVALDPDPAMLALLKAGRGVSFKTVGDGKKYRFMVAIPGVGDNNHGMPFTAASKEATITFEYKALTQEPYWGIVKAFNAKEIVQLKIQTIGQPIASFQFKIYDIQILK